MTKKEINRLISLFSQEQEIVWIADENWKILGGKAAYPYPVPLPELLGISADCWKKTEKKVYLDKHFLDCTVYADPAEKYRVIVLKKIKPDFPASEEDTSENYTVQMLHQTQNQLLEYLDEREDYEKSDLPEMFEKVSFLIQRSIYLRKLLQSVYSDTLQRTVFHLTDMLIKIKNNIQRTIGIYGEIQFSFPDQDACIYENMEFFTAVITAGLILCHQRRGVFQKICLSYHQMHDIAEIRIELTPDPARIVDMSRQIAAQGFTGLTEETQLLNTFCTIHDGSWKMVNQSGKNSSSSCCQITFSTSEKKEPMLISSPHPLPQDFSNVYQILLSRIYLSIF